MSRTILLNTLYRLPKAPGYAFVLNTSEYISIRLGSDLRSLHDVSKEYGYTLENEGRCYPSRIPDCRFFTIFLLNNGSSQVIIFVLNQTISNISFAGILLMYERILETADW
jgi:hypothetical protein